MLPGAVIPPGGEVFVDGALGWEVVGEHVPLAARAVEVEHGVDDFSHIGGPRSSAGLSVGDNEGEEFPLFVGEVAGVRLTCGGIHGSAPRVEEPDNLHRNQNLWDAHLSDK